ncbi:hypothetical protein ACMYR3_02320 [Ampullimonas aquatilis]|uniref:hypothetical protein n=1 Tax=Ampullimonas aquatilis TaxID=1341549 RepID=UPI003C733E51
MVTLEGRDFDSERPETYALYWYNHFIKIEAIVKGEGCGKFWEVIFWQILTLDIPEKVVARRDEIIKDLKEVIGAHGKFYDRSHIETVHIFF